MRRILFCDVPVLHVEHAGDVDLAVGTARRPRIFVIEELRRVSVPVRISAAMHLWRFGAAVIGLAIVAHAAQIGGEIVAQHIGSFASAQSVLIMTTAIVSGVGLTSSSGCLKRHREALVEELRRERRNHDRGVDRLVGEGDRHLVERQDLDVDVRDGEPVGFQHLADLVGRDRALAVAGDHLALELLRAA